MNAKTRFQNYEDLLRHELSALVDEVRSQCGVPGICLAVRTPHGNFALASGVRSTATQEVLPPNASFHVGCIAKLLLSIGLLEEAQHGTVNLNSKLSDSLSELSDWIHGSDVTVAHLLSHTSGYRSFPLMEPGVLSLTWNDFLAKLKASARVFTPGTVFSYEHTGAVLAAEILRRSTRKELPDSLAAIAGKLQLVPTPFSGVGINEHQVVPHLFDMQTREYLPTRHAGDVQGFWRPAFSNISLSVGDIAKIGSALCGWGDGPFGEPTLSGAVRGLVLKSVVRIPQFLLTPGPEAAYPTGFSLGAAQYANGWHGLFSPGLGQCVALLYHPATQVSIATGLNSSKVHVLQQLTLAAARISAGGKVETPPQICIVPDDVVGSYANGSAVTCEIRRAIDRFECRFPGNAPGHGISLDIDMNSNPVRISSNIPGVAITFLHSADTDAVSGLMFGLTAFKKLPPALN